MDLQDIAQPNAMEATDVDLDGIVDHFHDDTAEPPRFAGRLAGAAIQDPDAAGCRKEDELIGVGRTPNGQFGIDHRAGPAEHTGVGMNGIGAIAIGQGIEIVIQERDADDLFSAHEGKLPLPKPLHVEVAEGVRRYHVGGDRAMQRGPKGEHKY